MKAIHGDALWERWRPGRLATPAGLAGLILSQLLALVYLNWLFPDGFLLDATGYWLAENEDVAQYISGMTAFIREPWQWPLLKISSLNWPEGTLATFVDIIPAYAVVLKLLAGGVGVTLENPFGVWVGLCFLASAFGAWWILREGGNSSWAALTALTIFLVTYPALTARLGHISLMSHWLLLFAIALYVRSSRTGSPATVGWVVLSLLAFYVNIYLFTMVAGVLVADAARSWRTRGLVGVAINLAVPWLGVAASTLPPMFPMPAGAGAREGGFGIFSMNLLAPLSGGRFLIFENPIARAEQGEGFNYLGIAVLLAAVLAWRLISRKDRGFFDRHGPLIVVCALAAVYSLSNRVYLGQQLLFEWRVPGVLEGLVAQFRVSGRYFWLAGYCLVVFAVLGITRHLSRYRAAIVLSLLAVLHWWDLAPHHATVNTLASRTSTTIVSREAWDAFLGDGVSTIHFYPVFRCGSKPPFNTLLPTMRYASERGLNLSTGYVARASKACIDPSQGVPGAGDTTIAHVFVRDEYPQVPEVARLFGVHADVDCVEIDFASVCRFRD